jgi:hypothetical protein
MSYGNKTNQFKIKNKALDGEFIDTIITEIVKPTYRKDITYIFSWKEQWQKWANRLEILALACGVLSTCIAFAAASSVASRNANILSLVAGIFGVVAQSLLATSKIAKKQSSTKTKQANQIQNHST